MPHKIEISHRTIVFTVFFLLALWFLYFIRDLILEFFVALLLMTILEPFVNKLSKYKVPRSLAILISYILFFGILGWAIAIIIPPLVEQTANFANALPSYLSNLGVTAAASEEIVHQFILRIGSIPEQVVKVGVSIFSNIISVLTIFAFAFYLLLARGKLQDQLGIFFGDEGKKEVGKVIDSLEKKLGGWARGELSLMVLVGVANYIGLTLLGIPFSLSLAILAGLMEIIPYLGPVLAAIPSILIGFGISPIMGLAVTALAFLVQQIENYIFVPKVMEKSVGVAPIVTLLSLAIGVRVAGVAGMIISVPTVIALQVVLGNFFTKRLEN